MYVIKLATLADIHAVVIDPRTNYTVWARCVGITQDWRVWAGGYRLSAQGQVEINCGEWRQTFAGQTVQTEYLNEEWRIAELVYAKHPCGECGYPPAMCCLAGIDEDSLSDAAIDAYEAARDYIPLPYPQPWVDLPERNTRGTP